MALTYQGHVGLQIDIAGYEQSLAAVDPKNVYIILNTWYQRAGDYVRDQLRMRAPKRLKGKVYIRYDTVRPPRWARIGVKSPLTWLIEGGTGPAGDPSFNHVSRHWPAISGKYGLMEEMDLPAPEAFLVARSIARRGGNPAKPFIAPTFQAVKGTIDTMMTAIIQEVLGKFN